MSFLDRLFKIGARAAKSDKTANTASSDNNKEASSFKAVPDEYLALADLEDQRQLLEIRITGTSRAYQSMIIAVDVERGLLWLDDLFPQQMLLEVGDEITLRHHRNGEQLVICEPIVALGSTYNASGFAIALPAFAYYTPRRSSPRFRVGHQSPLSVKIRTLGQEPCYGTLQDISAGGLRVMVAGNLLAHLRHGALLPLCELDINADLKIRCRARICAFRLGRSPYRHTQISVEFIDLEESTRVALSRFLRETQLSSEYGSHQNIRANAA